MTQAGTQHVRIVMATRNGARFLPAQLQSFLDQDHTDWSLVVGDDGSDDDSIDILRAFASDHPDRDVVINAGPVQGGAANFLTQALRAARPGAWMAFSDQDDVWKPHKLTRALNILATRAGPDAIAAYGARTQLTDKALTPQGLSAHHARPPGLSNALLQNILGGNTILLTPAAATLLARSVPAALTAGVPFHDWWVYLLMSGAGGQIVMDDDAVLFYRQHSGNLLGHHGGAGGRLARAMMLVNGTYSGWIECNLAALRQCEALLTPDARALVQTFRDLRAVQNPRERVTRFKASGLYRQTPTGDRIMRLLAWSNRF